MRLRKVNYKRITLALFVFFLALTFVQCLFVVDGAAVAEAQPYRELISDYFSFNAPTRIAAGDGIVAVYDSGEVVIINGGNYIRFPVDAEDCDKLAVSEQGVVLLRGTGEDENASPEILCYSLSGQKLSLAIPSAQVDDLCCFDGKIYTLSAYLNVKGYSAQTGAEEVSFVLPRGSLYFAVASDGFYFRTVKGSLYKKTGDDYSANTAVGGEVNTFASSGAFLFYTTKNTVKVMRFSEESAFLSAGTADTAFSSVTDLAADGNFIYVLDASHLAIKVYDAQNGSFVKMIGSYGNDPKRLNAPVALAVKNGKVLVVDSRRGSEFSGQSVRTLNGRAVTSVTDIAVTSGGVYVADDGVVYEYNSDLVYIQGKSHIVGAYPCRYVSASPNGTVFACSGREVYAKKQGETRFNKIMTFGESEISGMTVGIGGNILYLLSGTRISACTQSGEVIATLSSGARIDGFAVDYRGSVYVVSGQTKKLYKFERVYNDYAAPHVFDLPSSYSNFSDIALDENGCAYLIADHNVLIYPKEAFSVFIKEDDAFTDSVPSVEPRFVCEVTKDSAVAYLSPGNFEDIDTLPKGNMLMCYAKVDYAGGTYVRAETEKGTRYIPLSDVKVFSEGAAPFSTARCLLPAIGQNVVGVDIYKEPSLFSSEALFSALGKDDLFEVISVVAVDETGKDVWGFYRVKYEGKYGYVRADEVVSPDDDPLPMPKTYEMQVKSDGLGKTVAVYKEADTESEVVASLSDGSKIKALEPLDQNKEFTMVLYEGEVRYVLTANLGEGGLSGGQVLAIVLTVVAAVGSVLTVLILRANKKHKRQYKE